MKKMSLIGISVVTAGILVTGCGSSSSGDTVTSTSGGTSGDAAINSVKQPTEMTDGNVTNVLNFLRQQFQQFGGGPAKIAAVKAKIQEANFAVVGGEPEPCNISGFVTYTETTPDDPDTFGGEYTVSWDNCVESGSYGTVDGVEMNRRTRNGTSSDYWLESVNADTNVESFSWGGADNYTDVFDNNETAVVSRTNKSTYTRSMTGEFKDQGAADDFDRFTMMANGIRQSEEVNATGDTIFSQKDVAENFTMEEYALLDGSAGSISADGGMSFYWQGTAEDAIYFNNFVFEWSRVNQEKTVLINGTAGSLCLGGSVTAQTTTAMKENQVDYFDGSDNTGSDVLPYAGGISLSGADSVTATVGFDTNDTNHTSATVTIGDAEPTTYTSWTDMTSGSTCSINFFID